MFVQLNRLYLFYIYSQFCQTGEAESLHKINPGIDFDGLTSAADWGFLAEFDKFGS
jgi:hypothetical protein